MTATDAAAARNFERFATGPTIAEIETWPATIAVPFACTALGISKSWGYQLISAGEFPCKVLMIGRRARVVTSSLLDLLRTGQAAI